MARRYRKRQYRRRRGLRKGARMGRVAPFKGILPGVHRFKELAQLTSLSAGVAATSAGVITFQLTDLFNVASFKNLFDLYKITGVRLKIVPQFNVSQFPVGGVAPAGPELLPMLYIAENRDPFVPAPTGAGDVLNDDGCKVIRLSRPINMYLGNPKPLILDTSPDGTITTQASWQFNSSSKALQPWLPTGGNGQTKDASSWKHYGFRYWIDNTQSTVPVTLLVYATYYFSMKEAD